MSVDAVTPWSAHVWLKVSTTIGPVIRRWTVTDSAQREWSSSQVMISVSAPVARRQWVKSDCHISLGRSALEPDIGGPGPFFGVGFHETQIDEAAADRRGRNGELVALLEVPANGVRAGVEAADGQL